jgi:hypothetical protein
MDMNVIKIWNAITLLCICVLPFYKNVLLMKKSNRLRMDEGCKIQH